MVNQPGVFEWVPTKDELMEWLWTLAASATQCPCCGSYAIKWGDIKHRQDCRLERAMSKWHQQRLGEY